MTDTWKSIDDKATAQLGLITSQQLRELGCSWQTERKAIASGRLREISRRVRQLGSVRVRGQTAMAAVLDSGGDTVLSHSTAAAWWGIAGFGLQNVEVTRSTRSSFKTALGATHRVRLLPPSWVTELHGIPIVRPELCILQLCATQPGRRAERALDNAWSLRLLSCRSLMALLSQYGEMGRNGTAPLRSFVDARGIDYTPPASNLESRVLQVLGREGLGGFRAQVDSGADRWVGRVDFRHQFRPVVIEVQSARYHSALSDREADRARREALEQAGLSFVEVTDEEAWSTDSPWVARVRSAISATSTTSTTSALTTALPTEPATRFVTSI